MTPERRRDVVRASASLGAGLQHIYIILYYKSKAQGGRPGRRTTFFYFGGDVLFGAIWNALARDVTTYVHVLLLVLGARPLISRRKGRSLSLQWPVVA